MKSFSVGSRLSLKAESGLLFQERFPYGKRKRDKKRRHSWMGTDLWVLICDAGITLQSVSLKRKEMCDICLLLSESSSFPASHGFPFLSRSLISFLFPSHFYTPWLQMSREWGSGWSRRQRRRNRNSIELQMSFLGSFNNKTPWNLKRGRCLIYFFYSWVWKTTKGKMR